MTQSISFQAALNRTKGTKRILLLGNGFSIASGVGKFSYTSLYEEAFGPISNKVRMSEIHAIFESNGYEDKDFERVSSHLQITLNILENYRGVPKDLMNKISTHREQLAELLAGIIAEIHPENLDAIDPDKVKDCQEFLSHFLGGMNWDPGEVTDDTPRIYTLNYDLLLYWVLNDALNNKSFYSCDGFGIGDGKVWGSEAHQNIFSLHGSLHLYTQSNDIKKRRYLDYSRSKILTQVKEAMMEGKFPLFISDGSADGKLRKIKGNAYLRYCYEDLKYNLKQSDVSLFILGCSLDEHDEHILKIIREGECEVFCSTYDASPEDVNNGNYTHCKECNNKEEAYPVELSPSNTMWGQRGPTFFCAKSAKVWGEDGKPAQGEEFSDF